MIRRLAAEGVPKPQIAVRLGLSRTTVIRAVRSDSPPNRCSNEVGFLGPVPLPAGAAWGAARIGMKRGSECLPPDLAESSA